MPWLQINGKWSFPFASTLVNIPGSIIENFKHGNDPIWRSIGSSDVWFFSPDIAAGNPNSSCWFWYFGSLGQCIINSWYWVLDHCHQETGWHLWEVCSWIEKGWSCMSKIFLAHQIISLYGWVNVIFVDSYWNSHKHVLGSFNNFSIH